MNKEQHNKLIKYEQIFRTAIESLYYRSMDKVFAADFISVCHELNIYINTSCPQCVLRALQAVGKLYFDYREPENPVKPELPEQSELPLYLPPTIPDNKPIKLEKKVHLSESKQPKKPVTIRSKTNKK